MHRCYRDRKGVKNVFTITSTYVLDINSLRDHDATFFSGKEKGKYSYGMFISKYHKSSIYDTTYNLFEKNTSLGTKIYRNSYSFTFPSHVYKITEQYLHHVLEVAVFFNVPSCQTYLLCWIPPFLLDLPNHH